MIAVYGLKFIIVGIVLTAGSVLLAAYRDSMTLFVISIILAVLTIFLTFFYRNPSRTIPADDHLILSNADGRVLSVENISNEFIGGKGYKVSIFLSIFNVHINRVPAAGTVEYTKYTPGKFLPAFKPDASSENEQSETGLKTPFGKIIFKQISGILARRIENDLEAGEQVKAGEVYGMIHFGSRAEFFLPENTEIMVRKGDAVKGGLSPIARFRE
jgi:phosphatidylserine decarboxylase